MRNAARQLFAQTCLQDDEINARLDQTMALEYWGEMNPSLSVGMPGASSLVEKHAIASRSRNELSRRFFTEGYFQTEPIFSVPLIESMRTGIEVLRQEGWPPVFSFVYDEFWRISRGPSLQRLLSMMLGAEYRQTSNVWTHYVHSEGRGRGFQPHTDDRDSSNRLTVWISLTDATLENGCMYLIPRNINPQMSGERYSGSDTFNKSEVRTLLQGSLALPVQAGTVLGWDSDVIHWGSLYRLGSPRISISMQFIGEHLDPAAYELPLLDVGSSVPTFAQRLHAIGSGILAYHTHEPGTGRYLEFARRLLDSVRLV
jgi:hypothetical protein